MTADSPYKNCTIGIKTYTSIRSKLLDWQKLVGIVKQYSPNPKRILDIGCGYGLLTFKFADNFPATKIVGSDLNKDRIQVLRKINRNKNIQFHSLDAINSISKADTIACVDLLHHLPYHKQEIFLEKIKQKMKKNSTLIIKDMNGKVSFRQLCNIIIDLVSAKEYGYYRTHDTFEDLFKRKGFAIIEKRSINKWWIPLNHIIFVLKKC